MISAAFVVLLAVLGQTPPQAGPAVAPPLFDRLVGRWVLTGTIDKQQTTHDVEADLVLTNLTNLNNLNWGYVRLHEVSREKDAAGAPRYEAIVFISVDAKTGEYACLWLDNTSNAGLTNGGVGRGMPKGNTIPFLIKLNSGEVFHTTFIYDPPSDSWRWELDGESNGVRESFARLTLTRR